MSRLLIVNNKVPYIVPLFAIIIEIGHGGSQRWLQDMTVIFE